MTTIYLIRHGQASFGAESYDKLSPNGELQAILLGQYFNQILKEAPYVVAGSMQRHQQTATLALHNAFPKLNLKLIRLGMSLIISKYLPNTNHVLINHIYSSKMLKMKLIHGHI